MTLPELSAMGTVLILVICAVRAAARDRIPRRAFVVLWILAAIRFILPLQISTPLSIYGLFPTQNVQNGAMLTETVAGSHPPGPAALQGTAAVDVVTQRASAVPDPWTIVWWAGFIACAGIVAAAYIRWMRRFAESLPVDAQAVRSYLRQYPLRRRIDVRTSSYINAPLTYGTLHPVILLPPSLNLKQGQQLEFILTHEYVHIQHFDALLKIMLTAVCCVHWFNPLVWVMYILAARDMEVACDENVVARCGRAADYARMLIQLEAQKIRYIVPGMGCSAGAMKERIQSIMKPRKKSVLTLVVAGALVACVGTAFATNTPTAESDALVTEAVSNDTSLAEANDIEWWTAEDYEVWLEREKADLQSILGSKCWTPSEGEFVWTQEKIDETIELYEQVLQDIRRGVLVSKSVNGDDAITIMQGTMEQGLGLPTTYADQMEPEALKEYAAFGLVMESGAPVYQGEKVKYFEDSVEIEPGMTASRTAFLADEGTAFIRTVRRPTQNPDGSTDPFGQLIGIERIPADEAADILENIRKTDVTVTVEDEVTLEDLAPYTAFGLEYEAVPDGFRMYYDGKPVHSLFDPVTGTWFASNMHGFNLGSDRVDLEAVYQDGRLAGFEILPEQHEQTMAQTAYVSDSMGRGRTFEEVFETYKPFGLTCERAAEFAGGAGYNLFWNGRPVNHFADIAPGGSAFSFESAEQTSDGLSVHVVYDGQKPVRIEED